MKTGAIETLRQGVRILAVGILVSGVVAQGAVRYSLEGPTVMDGTAAGRGPSMDGNLIPEWPSGLSISAWVKPASFVGGPHEIFRIEDSAARVIFSFQSNGQRLAFGIAQTGYNELRTADSTDFAASMMDGNWHFVCATASAYGRRHIWVDGVDVTSGDIGDIRVARGKLGWVGSMGGTGEFFNGGLADVRVSDDYLDADAIRTAFGDGLIARGTRWTWAGADGADWNAAANWTTGGVAAASAPVTACVAVVTAPAAVALSADAACGAIQLAGSGNVSFSGATLTTYRLDIAAGAVLDIAAGTEIHAYSVTRGGVPVPYGAYTGSGTDGHQVSWLSGAGVLRIAAPSADVFPTEVVEAGEDGWCTLGLASGYSMGENQGWVEKQNYQFIAGEYVHFENLAFPESAKLKLVGGVLADRIPIGRFTAVDTSGLKKLALGHAVPHLHDGSLFTVPSGCDIRYFPGTYSWSEANNCWYHSSLKKRPYDGDLAVNGKIEIVGNGHHYNPRVFHGLFAGGGTLYIQNFGNHIRFTDGFAFTGTISGLQQGCAFWLDTTSVTGRVAKAVFSSCTGTYSTQTSWSSSGVLFGRHNSDAVADHELHFALLEGNGSTAMNGATRWRLGGHVIVWGGNTVHVGELKYGLHVVARRQDQDCVSGWFGYANCVGTGNIVIDTFTSGNLYPSTNVNVKVGKVVAASAFDYTCQSNNVNRMVLDITNSCNASAQVKATDLGMLPARISGFAGTVTLTDPATRSYTVPIDFTHGTNYLYNTVGCIGSGTLAAAPAAGSIDVTFPTTGDRPVKGEYAIARFAAGGDLLAGWTVTLNGQARDKAAVRGMVIELKKDATGLWLDVRRTGLTFSIR